ncbi:MAG: 23S rRNA (adenine(2503)-C(2))-methyltransferase RlmN [Patescibacteria group bacterium]
MLSPQALEQFCKAEKIPAFRVKQILEAIYEKGVQSYDEISTLPKDLRKTLSEKFPISTVTPSAHEISADGSTEKVLFKLRDEGVVESVLMHFKDGRKTVCVSSEVGCPLKCTFCASGTLLFKRSLQAEEIADQVIYFGRALKRKGERLNHVVYMGIGEPFRNYDNLIKSLKILMDDKFLGLGARKITVSTAGIADKIRTFADEPFQVNLALSLHAPTQELRAKIMPISRRFTLDEVMESVKYYLKKTNRRISFEYVMLNGINDTEECAHQLVKLIREKLGPLKKLTHVNMIPYNATDIAEIKGSTKEQMRKFRAILEKANIPATIRVSLGQDIAAACGQLANKVEKKEKV